MEHDSTLWNPARATSPEVEDGVIVAALNSISADPTSPDIRPTHFYDPAERLSRAQLPHVVTFDYDEEQETREQAEQRVIDDLDRRMAEAIEEIEPDPDNHPDDDVAFFDDTHEPISDPWTTIERWNNIFEQQEAIDRITDCSEVELYLEQQRRLRRGYVDKMAGEAYRDTILAILEDKRRSQVNPSITRDPSDHAAAPRIDLEAAANPKKVTGVGPAGPLTQGQLDAHYGYVYRVEHTPTGRYYIGQHKHPRRENFMYYLGSGLRWRAEILDRFDNTEISKKVLAFCDNSMDLTNAERWFIFCEAIKQDTNFLNLEVVFDLDWLGGDEQLLDPYRTWHIDPPRHLGDEWVATYRIHNPFSPLHKTLQVVGATKEQVIEERAQALRDYAADYAKWQRADHEGDDPRPRCDTPKVRRTKWQPTTPA